MDSMIGVATVVGGASFPVRATAVYAPIGDDEPGLAARDAAPHRGAR